MTIKFQNIHPTDNRRIRLTPVNGATATAAVGSESAVVLEPAGSLSFCLSKEFILSCAWRTLAEKEAYLTLSGGYSYYSAGVSLGFDFYNFLPIREEQLDSIDRIKGFNTDFFIDDAATGVVGLTHIGSLDMSPYIPAFRAYIDSTYVEGETKYDTYDRYYIHNKTPVADLPPEIKSLVESLDVAVGDGNVSNHIELTMESEIRARRVLETGEDIALQSYWVNLRLYSSSRTEKVAEIKTVSEVCQVIDDQHIPLTTLSSKTSPFTAWTPDNFPIVDDGNKFVLGSGTVTSLNTATGYITKVP